jgi:lysine-specific demethylase/histidyl-hydroxylase NO66
MQALARIAVDLADAAFDQLSRRFLSERLPPFLTPREEAASAAALAPRIAPFTHLRMLRPGLACAVVEEGVVIAYHCVDNSRELFGAPLNPLTFELDDGPCVEALLRAYPHSVTVQELPHPSEEDGDRVEVAQALFREGFLVIVDEATLPSHLHVGVDGDEGEEDDSPF